MNTAHWMSNFHKTKIFKVVRLNRKNLNAWQSTLKAIICLLEIIKEIFMNLIFKMDN
jgi:hypothetical protein